VPEGQNLNDLVFAKDSIVKIIPDSAQKQATNTSQTRMGNGFSRAWD